MSRDEDDRPPEPPKPRTLDEANRHLADAYIVLQAQLGRGNTIGVYRIRRVIDSLLEARWRLSGNAPVCHSAAGDTGEPCGRVMDTFGTETDPPGVHLCGSCDFPHCATGCGRRAIALSTIYCHTCLAVADA